MLTSLVFLATLQGVPNQSATLKLDNIQPTYGLFGPKRDGTDFLPGDIFMLEWVIKGLKADKEGKAVYSMAVEIKNGTGKVVFAQKPQKREHVLTLGGDQVPGFFSTTVGSDTTPGKYTIKISVEDLKTNAKDSFERTFTALKSEFGLVRTFLSYDKRGEVPASSTVVVGQTIQLNSFVTGVATSKEGKSAVKVTMRILDAGKEVIEPLSGTTTQVPDPRFPDIPLSYIINLNREGTFEVELKVEDLVAKKTKTEKFTLKVVGR